jgi:hypothetical protein
VNGTTAARNRPTRSRIPPVTMRGCLLTILLAAVAVGCGQADRAPTCGGTAKHPAPSWPLFGFDAARWNAAPESVWAGAGTATAWRRTTVRLPGTVDSSPVFASRARVGGRVCDVFVVTTTYGRTVAIDAHSGERLWTSTPRGIEALERSAQITTASPALDLNAAVVFAASPDGRIHRLRLADGTETAEGDWPVAVTRDAAHEKIASALNLVHGRLLVTTGGYLGDAPPYQGHVLAIDARSGRIDAVFNALCADRAELLSPDACDASGAAIWARGGAVVDPRTGRWLVATGNAPWDGRRSFGDSVLALTPRGRLAGSYTPANQHELDIGDVDLGSTPPVPLPDGLIVQSGKDGLVRLLDHSRFGVGRLGGDAELMTVAAPGRQAVFSDPAVARGNPTLVIYANHAGTTAYAVRGRALAVGWRQPFAGTSPVIVGDRLLVFDPDDGVLRILAVRSGRVLATLPAAAGHWNSPIVGDGVIALPTGDANAHETTGTLSLYRR